MTKTARPLKQFDWSTFDLDGFFRDLKDVGEILRLRDGASPAPQQEPKKIERIDQEIIDKLEKVKAGDGLLDETFVGIFRLILSFAKKINELIEAHNELRK